MSSPTVISTFSGGGGSSLGYRLAGFDVRLAVEWDPVASGTYAANFPSTPIFGAAAPRRGTRERVIFVGAREDLGVCPAHPRPDTRPIPLWRALDGLEQADQLGPVPSKKMPPRLLLPRTTNAARNELSRRDHHRRPPSHPTTRAHTH